MVEFTVFKGSQSGDIVESRGHRDPRPTEAIVKITHCGVCGTDEHYVHADQGIGHEGVGIITELGTSVQAISEFRVGDRVGFGWFHGYCGYCKQCIAGWQNRCLNGKFYGNDGLDQGGFGGAVAWDVSALYKIPDEIPSEDAGPLMCGGASVWSPLYDFGLKAGDRVGIIGIGGLGHFAIQFAAKMGMEAVVFSSTDSKKDEAFTFGASEFHSTRGVQTFVGVDKLDALLITTSASPDFSLYLPILQQGAKVFPLTISTEPMPLSPLAIIMGNIQIIGSGGAPKPSMRAMLEFVAKHSIKPRIQRFPLTKAGIIDAQQKLRDGNMRYRGVLVAQ